MIELIVFGLVFVFALGCSIAMLFAKNAVHTALFLVGSQVALAVAFLLQGAHFVAAVQIIIYAGAIMVLFLFVVMLLGVDRSEVLVEPLPGQRQIALALGALLAAGITYIALTSVDLIGADRTQALAALNREPGNVLALARVLFSRYLLGFEATSVLLVTAIVGVMVLARRVDSVTALSSTAPSSEEREVA